MKSLEISINEIAEIDKRRSNALTGRSELAMINKHHKQYLGKGAMFSPLSPNMEKFQ